LTRRVRGAAGSTFRSLKVRNYKLFFFGQLVSVSGTWMQQVAQDWLVLKLSDSGTAVGITTGLQFLPMLLFGMVGGIIADRRDKRRVLLATQTTAGLIALAMGVLVMSGHVALWHVYLLAFLLGCVTAVDNPTRQAFVTEMVGPDEVTNAVGLNSATFNAARVVGPAVAAIVIQVSGIAPAFFVNAASYLAVLAGLHAMRPEELFRQAPAPRSAGQIREGLRYVWATPELRSTIALVLVVATFGMNLSVVLPLLARFTFHGTAGTYGLLMSTMAVGSLGGALVAANRTRIDPRLRVATAGVFGALSMLTAAAPTLWLAAVLLVSTGAAAITFMALSNSTLQLSSAAHMRGRVMALYALVFLGSTPIGGPLIGWLSEVWSPRWSFALGGAITVVGAAVTWLRLPKPAVVTPRRPIARRALTRVAWWA
jgi:MFS family permease